MYVMLIHIHLFHSFISLYLFMIFISDTSIMSYYLYHYIHVRICTLCIM